MSYLHGRSVKQKCASTSSSDAEVMALCEALKQCVWMRELIRELHITNLEEVVVYQDNQSVIQMATEDSLLKNSKHILTKLTYARQLIRSGAVRVEYKYTLDMTSDVLSKPLHGALFYKHVSQMMGLELSRNFKDSAIPPNFASEE
jgi:hypothetical protein